MKTISITENATPGSSVAKASHIISVTSGNYSNALGSQTLVLPVPSVKVKYNTNAGGRNMIDDNFYLSLTNIEMYECSCSTGKKSLAYNTNFEVPKSPSSWTINLTELFNSNNPTVRTVPLNWKIQASPFWIATYKRLSSGEMEIVGERTTSFTGNIAGEGSITLNAPPTFDNTDLSFSTPDIYTSITTASISVSNLSAKYGGDISQVELKIGTQTATRSTAGTLEILLGYAGTFTPTISVTDSRGQVTTKSLPALVVQEYSAPQVAFSIDRTNQNGVPEDEGTCALLKASFHWVSEIANLQVPTISITDPDGQSVTATITWYKDASLTTVLSDWSALTATDMPVYGLIDNSSHNVFNTSYSYQIGLVPSDTIGSGVEVLQTLGLAFYTMDFLAGGHGIAFGKPSKKEGFDCGMVPYFNTWAGMIQMFAGDTAPDGWLICDGSAVSRTDYPLLFDAIGIKYGEGDRSTTFNLPDMRDRFPVGAGNDYVLNDKGGSNSVTLGTNEIPAHTHGEKSLTGYVTLRKTGAGYHTAVSRDGIVSSIEDSGSGTSVNGSGSTGQKLDQVNFNATHTHDRVGGGKAHENRPPYIAINYVICVG